MGNSPDVYTREKNLSQRITADLSTIGAVVGRANRGPVGEATLITSETQFLATFGEPDYTLGFSQLSAIAFLAEASRCYFTRVAPEALYGGCIIGFDGKFNTSREFTAGEADPETMQLNGSDLFVVYGKDPGTWNDTVLVRIYPDVKTTEAYFYVEVFVEGTATAVEKHRVHLDYIIDGNGTQVNVETYINRNSDYIRISQNFQATAYVANPSANLINTYDAGGIATQTGIRLKGGHNGRTPTEAEMVTAWDLYEDKEALKVSILMQAGYESVAFQLRMDEICQDRMDCVAILDTPVGSQQYTNAIAWRRANLALDSSYSALYNPFLYLIDKYSDRPLYVPPSGFVGACYAATDRDYAQWWAPAGLTRGQLPVSGLRYTFDQGQRDALYESQINCIRKFQGNGICVWGADTLAVEPSALNNISVRRLMILLEVTLENSLLYSVFDPNSATLRSRLQTDARDFLGRMQAAGALYSYGAECNDSNNPASSIASGDLVLDIYVDPVLPVKRILFTATVNRTGVRVTASQQ